MDSVRPFIPRRQPRMGEVVVEVTVTNGGDPARKKRFDGVVDTGATGLILPLAWKEDLGELETLAMVDLETADQRIVTAEICGPVWIWIDGSEGLPVRRPSSRWRRDRTATSRSSATRSSRSVVWSSTWFPAGWWRGGR